MDRTLKIVLIVVVVLALAWLAYKFIFKKPEDGTPCQTDNNEEGTYLNGECIKSAPGYTGPNLDQNIEQGNLNPINVIKLVNEKDVYAAPDPSNQFNNLGTSNMLSSGIIIDTKHTKNNPQKIRFNTLFSKPVDNYVWFNHWIYKFKEKSTSNSGIDTRVYEVSKDSLPSEIKIITPNKCDVFKFYISGIEYKYDNTVTAQAGPVQIIYCIYKKQ